MGLPVIIFFSAAVFYFIVNPFKALDFKVFIIAILPYLMFAISAFYSSDFNSAIKKLIETRISLLIIPLGFLLIDVQGRKNLKSILFKFEGIFIASTLILCLIYFCYLPLAPIPDIPYFRFPSGFFFKTSAFNMPFWHLEPVYFSFVVVIAYILLFKCFYNKKISILPFLVIILVYASVLILMASKLALLFTFIFTLYAFFYTVKNKKVRFTFMFLVLLSVYPILKTPSIQYEIEEIQFFLRGEKRAKNDTNDKRSLIIKSSIELAKNVNPILGTGIGDVQKELNEVYRKNGYEQLLEKKYDAHNQFLSMYLGTGSLGLLALIFLLSIWAVLNYKKKDFFSLSVVVFFILQMFTETVLERQIPVILFSIFVSIILFLDGKN